MHDGTRGRERAGHPRTGTASGRSTGRPTAARWARVGVLRLLVVGLLACAPAGNAELAPRSTLFIGIDVSGSFQSDGRYHDAMAFAAHYIYGHLAGKAELEEPRALFVGSIGGETPGQPQAFHPIHDFEGKTPTEIEADLRDWFAPDDRLTDFNAFFRRAASLVQRQNLVLAPITLVLLTDGVPDVGRQDGQAEGAGRYAQIDLEPLEYLARNVTVRVLYPDPTVAVHWERDVPRERVRMWTVDHVVMRGWREQLREPEPPATGEVAAAAGADEIAAAAGAERPEAAPDGAPEGAPDHEQLREPADDPVMEAREPAGDSVIQAGEPAGDSVIRVRGVPVSTASAGSAGNEGATAFGAAEPVRTQPELWRWIEDNIDFRVGRRVY